MRNHLRKVLIVTVAAAGLSAGAAQAASASPHPYPYGHSHSLTATTRFDHRLDSGGNGDWATDKGTRTITYRNHGFWSGVYHFTAKLKDTGTFRTLPFAFAPNQFGFRNGQHELPPFEKGTFYGDTTYTFTSTQLPHAFLWNLGVPRHESGNAVTTGDWFKQAFGPSAVLVGGIDNDWEWFYHTPFVIKHGPHHTIHVQLPQNWTDAAWNNGGQSLFAGQIR